jgi:hypothetical protein
MWGYGEYGGCGGYRGCGAAEGSLSHWVLVCDQICRS